MGFKTFYEKVLSQIGEYLPERHNVSNVSIYEALKSNGVRKTGLTFEHKEGGPQPTIYLEEFYQEYKSGATIEKICQWIAEIYKEALEAQLYADIRDFTSYENVCEKICLRLVNYEFNKEFLSSGVPHIKVADLAVCFYIYLQAGETGMATLAVKDEMLSAWGITVEELDVKARENTLRILKPGLYSVADMIMQNKVDLLEGGVKTAEELLYTLAAEIGSYGAVLILFPELMKKVREIIGEFYILPSSVNETILIAKKVADPVVLGRIVREVNETQVAKEEWLSEHVYELVEDSEGMSLTIVKESRADWIEEQ